MYEYKIIFTREWKNKLVRVGNTLDINENPEEPIDKFVLAIGKKKLMIVMIWAWEFFLHFIKLSICIKYYYLYHDRVNDKKSMPKDYKMIREPD